MDFTTKDSGTRQEFDTGSRRDTREGKGRYDLLPFHGIRRLAGLYERGAAKYGDRNWEKGQPLSRYCDSMLRHAFQAAAGHTDEDHFAAVAWNALAVIDHQERLATGELDAALGDLPAPAGRFDLDPEQLRRILQSTVEMSSTVRRNRKAVPQTVEQIPGQTTVEEQIAEVTTDA